MAIHVRCLNDEDHNQILVNGKIVRKDMDGTWKVEPGEELTVTEAKAFDAFRDTIENHAKLGVQFAEYQLKN